MSHSQPKLHIPAHGGSARRTAAGWHRPAAVCTQPQALHAGKPAAPSPAHLVIPAALHLQVLAAHLKGGQGCVGRPAAGVARDGPPHRDALPAAQGGACSIPSSPHTWQQCGWAGLPRFLLAVPPARVSKPWKWREDQPTGKTSPAPPVRVRRRRRQYQLPQPARCAPGLDRPFYRPREPSSVALWTDKPRTSPHGGARCGSPALGAPPGPSHHL